MGRRYSLIAIYLSMLVIGAGYASAFLPGGAPRSAAFAFALATAAVMTAILVLGAARLNRPLGHLKWVFAFVFMVLAGGFCAALLHTTAESRELWLGLPRGAAIILYVAGLVPMAVLPIAYALTFDKTTLDDAALEELRHKLTALRTDATAPVPDLRS